MNGGERYRSGCLSYARSLSFDIGAAGEKLNLCRYGLSNNIVLWGHWFAQMLL